MLIFSPDSVVIIFCIACCACRIVAPSVRITPGILSGPKTTKMMTAMSNNSSGPTPNTSMLILLNCFVERHQRTKYAVDKTRCAVCAINFCHLDRLVDGDLHGRDVG